MGCQVEDTMKIPFGCQFFHGHPAGTIGMKWNHLIVHTLQFPFNRLRRFCDEAEKGQCNPSFLCIRLPLTTGHAANGCRRLVQNNSGNTVHSEQIHHAVYHGDVFGADSVLHVFRRNG